MGMFIEISVRDDFLATPAARRLVEECPVEIFEAVDGRVRVNGEKFTRRRGGPVWPPTSTRHHWPGGRPHGVAPTADRFFHTYSVNGGVSFTTEIRNTRRFHSRD